MPQKSIQPVIEVTAIKITFFFSPEGEEKKGNSYLLC